MKTGDKVKWNDPDAPGTGVVVDEREDGWLGVVWDESHTIYSPVEHLAAVEASDSGNAGDNSQTSDTANDAGADDQTNAGGNA